MLGLLARLVKNKKDKKRPPYRCLPCRGRGAYARSNIDLVNQKHRTKQNKEKKTQARIHLLQKKWRGIHCEEYMLCITASNNILENANHCDEDIAVYF